MNRAVITGLGIYSCLGTTLDAVEQSLREGRSGITLDPQRKELGFRSALTARLDTPDLKGELSRSQRTYMPEQAKYAYVATRDALRQAGLDADYIDRHDVGILYGNDSTAEAVVHSMDLLREKRDTTLIGSGSIFQSMNSTVTMNLSCIFRLRGINLTISGACASGAHAIGLGALLIRQGLQECIVCGGAQEVNPTAVGSFDGIGAFSTRESDPTRASRPFDRDRDGLVPGGGAATVVLESYEHARRRGATILAEVLGYGFSSNGDHISVPNVDGPLRSLRMAVADAGVPLESIGYINAHATSTPVGDRNEALALTALLAVRTGADDLDAPVSVAIDVGVAPGIVRDLFQVPSLDVVLRHGGDGGRLHQRVQSLLRGGVEAVVHSVHLKGLLEALDLRPGHRALGLRHLGADARHHQSRQQAEDHHHHHDLDQREAAPAGLP